MKFKNSLSIFCLLLLCICIVGCSGDDDNDNDNREEEILFSFSNEEIMIFDNVQDAVLNSQGKPYSYIKNSSLYIQISKNGSIYFGKVHNYPKEILNTSFGEIGKEIIVSGEIRKSSEQYSDVPENISIEFYLSKIND